MKLRIVMKAELVEWSVVIQWRRDDVDVSMILVYVSQSRTSTMSPAHATVNCSHLATQPVSSRNNYFYVARQKSNPLKIRYLWNCSKFFLQINSAYRGEFRPYILQISLQYLLAFQNYNYLKLNVHFSK